ncbi:MAG: phosphatase PAP2 family protein [Candidatus Accumulibacter sp.]|jgi:membrane-associated PAP2 superfamily phosphatase|nr:phosphatase PAP2 family protein [Accumulibacter sp.]
MPQYDMPEMAHTRLKPPLNWLAKLSWPRRQWLLLLVSALFLFLTFEYSPLDMVLERLFFDPINNVFPARRTWFFENFMHDGIRRATILAVCAASVICFFGIAGKLHWLPRRNSWLALLGMLIIAGMTPLLKIITNRHCPWSLVEFGGFAPYDTLSSPAPASLKAGRCFPSGHASSGYLWLAWFFALRPVRRRSARLALAAGLFLGGLFGLSRMAQGAHFLSHVLWSLWFAWAISLTLTLLLKVETKCPRRPP